MSDALYVGLAEIQEMFDVPKSTASSWTRQHGFPAPAFTLKAGPVWRTEDVRAWRHPVKRVTTSVRCPTCGTLVGVNE